MLYCTLRYHMLFQMETLVYVTQNPNKLADTRRLLPNIKIERTDFEVPEIQSLDPHEVAEHKLRFAYEQTKMSCFVTDTSLFLECLNGFPGPLVKWYFSNSVGGDKTCEIARLFGQTGIRWTTVLGYFDGRQVRFIEETVEGSVSDTPRGRGGYDWDVIFIPQGEVRTFAEMTFDEKQKYSVTRRLLENFQSLLAS